MKTTWIQADYYFNHKDDFDKRAMIFGADCVPVDIQGGLVVKQQDKYGEDKVIGDQTQQNIQERFSLQTPQGIPDDEVSGGY